MEHKITCSASSTANASYVGKMKLDLWGCFVGRADMFTRNGLHLSGKGAAVVTDELSTAVDSGTGKIYNIFGGTRCLKHRGLLRGASNRTRG